MVFDEILKCIILGHNNGLKALLSTKEGKACLDTKLPANHPLIPAYLASASLLHLAAYYDRPDSITLLINGGIDKNVLDNQHQTALFIAVTHNRLAAMETLLKHGANPRLADIDRTTPLLQAIRRSASIEVIEHLLKSDAIHDINVGNKYHVTPLDQAAKYSSAPIVKLLLDWGAHVRKTREYVSVEGQQIDLPATLSVAAHNKNPGVISLLLPLATEEPINTAVQSADIKELINQALYNAVYSAGIDAVDALIAAGADVNARDFLGEAPLHVAASRFRDSPDNTTMLKLIIASLVKHGANRMATNSSGDTPLDLVARCSLGDSALLQALAADDAVLQALTFDPGQALRNFIIKSNNAVALEELLKDKDGYVRLINQPDLDGMTMLHIAAVTHSSPAIMEVLLKYGANIGVANRSGRTPLGTCETPQKFAMLINSVAPEDDPYKGLLTAIATGGLANLDVQQLTNLKSLFRKDIAENNWTGLGHRQPNEEEAAQLQGGTEPHPDLVRVIDVFASIWHEDITQELTKRETTAMLQQSFAERIRGLDISSERTYFSLLSRDVVDSMVARYHVGNVMDQSTKGR